MWVPKFAVAECILNWQQSASCRQQVSSINRSVLRKFSTVSIVTGSDRSLTIPPLLKCKNSVFIKLAVTEWPKSRVQSSFWSIMLLSCLLPDSWCQGSAIIPKKTLLIHIHILGMKPHHSSTQCYYWPKSRFDLTLIKRSARFAIQCRVCSAQYRASTG